MAETVTEQWVYVGVRVTSKGARAYGWLRPEGTVGFYRFARDPHCALGGTYEVQVSREGGHIYMLGVPRFTGVNEEYAAERAGWAAAERAALTKLAAAKRERDAAKQNPLDEALEPLLAVAAKYRNVSDLDALVAYVNRSIYEARWKK